MQYTGYAAAEANDVNNKEEDELDEIISISVFKERNRGTEKSKEAVENEKATLGGERENGRGEELEESVGEREKVTDGGERHVVRAEVHRMTTISERTEEFVTPLQTPIQSPKEEKEEETEKFFSCRVPSVVTDL